MFFLVILLTNIIGVRGNILSHGKVMEKSMKMNTNNGHPVRCHFNIYEWPPIILYCYINM